MAIEFIPDDDSDKEHVFITNVRKATLEFCQEKVGGFVQIIHLNKRQMLVDEDGLPKKRSLNTKASMLAGMTIVGDVLILDGEHLWVNW